jgi:hypothetical protein
MYTKFLIIRHCDSFKYGFMVAVQGAFIEDIFFPTNHGQQPTGPIASISPLDAGLKTAVQGRNRDYTAGQWCGQAIAECHQHSMTQTFTIVLSHRSVNPDPGLMVPLGTLVDGLLV